MPGLGQLGYLLRAKRFVGVFQNAAYLETGFAQAVLLDVARYGPRRRVGVELEGQLPVGLPRSRPSTCRKASALPRFLLRTRAPSTPPVSPTLPVIMSRGSSDSVSLRWWTWSMPTPCSVATGPSLPRSYLEGKRIGAPAGNPRTDLQEQARSPHEARRLPPSAFGRRPTIGFQGLFGVWQAPHAGKYFSRAS